MVLLKKLAYADVVLRILRAPRTTLGCGSASMEQVLLIVKVTEQHQPLQRSQPGQTSIMSLRNRTHRAVFHSAYRISVPRQSTDAKSLAAPFPAVWPSIGPRPTSRPSHGRIRRIVPLPLSFNRFALAAAIFCSLLAFRSIHLAPLGAKQTSAYLKIASLGLCLITRNMCKRSIPKSAGCFSLALKACLKACLRSVIRQSLEEGFGRLGLALTFGRLLLSA